jgi:hypothetical protein
MQQSVPLILLVALRASGGYRLFTDANATAGVILAPEEGSWSSLCDRRIQALEKELAELKATVSGLLRQSSWR